MANYHILEVGLAGDQARVVFHIPVPNENNSAGMNLREALIQFRSFSTKVPFINPNEENLIINGEIFELIESVTFDPELTNAQKNQIIKDRAIVLLQTFPDKIRSILEFWGFNGTVA